MTLFRMRVVPWHALEVARVIEISDAHTLADLHAAIQLGFELDDDHMYAFFMNGHVWDRDCGIWGMPELGRPSAEGTRIGELELRQNRRFVYLFDFGDELVFHVRVEKISESEPAPARPKIVESIGEAPAQYPHLDEEREAHAHREPDPALADLATRLEPWLVLWRWEPDIDEPEPPPATEEAYSLAIELLERARDDFDRIHLDVEHAVEASVIDWLLQLPNELAENGRAAEGVALAERLLSRRELLGLRTALPRWLVAAGRADEARASIEQNLEKEPDDPRALHEAALAYGQLGEREREEHCLREALRFVGTMARRTDIVERLTRILREDGRSAELKALLRAEAERQRTLQTEALGLTASTPVQTGPKIGRNDPCPCGSGKKYKKCCAATARPA